jgi:phage shock protein C
MNQLHRSADDRIIAGVAGGVGEALRVDSTLVRIAWAILVPLTQGLMLLLYIVMAIVVPQRAGGEMVEGDVVEGAVAGDEQRPRPARASGNPSVIIGIVLVVLGAYFLVREYIPAIDFGRIWPLVLIVIGVVLLLGAMRRSR